MRVIKTSILFLTLAAGLLSGLVAGCGTESTSPPPTLFTDALGRAVVIPDSVGRIVSLAPSATETIFAAGAARKIVGVTTADDYPIEIVSLPRVTAFPAVDYERIVSLKPDLIVASADVNGPDVAERMSEFAVPVFYLGTKTLDDVFDNIRIVGTLTGTSQKADTQAGLLEQSVVQINTLASSASRTRPKVLVLIGTDELYSFGNGSYVNEMVRRAGGVSITEEIPMAAPVLSEEFVLAQQPDVVIITAGDSFSIQQLLNSHPSWTALPAVANNRVHSIDPDLVLRPGPRVVDGILFLATWITPEMLTDSQSE